MPVTGRMPIAAIPTGIAGPGLTIWECEDCKALINDVTGHENWHEKLREQAG